MQFGVLLLISECILLKVVQDYNTHIENKYSTVLIFYSEMEFIYNFKISEIDLRAQNLIKQNIIILGLQHFILIIHHVINFVIIKYLTLLDFHLIRLTNSIILYITVQQTEHIGNLIYTRFTILYLVTLTYLFLKKSEVI